MPPPDVCRPWGLLRFFLPLGPFVEAGAPGTKGTLLVTVVKRQQGVGAQTLNQAENQTQMLDYAVTGCVWSTGLANIFT